MKWTVMIVVLINSVCHSGQTVLYPGESPPTVVLDEVFTDENDLRYIVDGYINMDPDGLIRYSVWDEYSVAERKIAYQQCQKFLLDETERLLYMYQYVVEPHPFPFREYELPGPPIVPLPVAFWMCVSGCVCLLFSKSVVGR